MKSYPNTQPSRDLVSSKFDGDRETTTSVSPVKNRNDYQFEPESHSILDPDKQSPYESSRTLDSYSNDDVYSLLNSGQNQHKHRKYNSHEEDQSSTLKYKTEPFDNLAVLENHPNLFEDPNHCPSETISAMGSFEVFNSDSSRNELVVKNLIITSDYFLNKAHEIVLDANTVNGSKAYFKMIKLSIKSLLLLVKKYIKCLNPYLELIIYFKLAKIYFTETENLNRADDYANKAISIATRNNLIKVKFICEFLATQILEKSNPRLCLNYINERIANFRLISLHSLSSLFALLKINNLLSQEPNTGLIVLQSLCQDPKIDDITKALCFIYQANLHLYRGSPNYSLDLLNNAEKLMHDHEGNYPIQLKAILSLLKYSVYIQIDDKSGSKNIMQSISDFILSEQLKHWNNWKEDGTFQINIAISSNYDINDNLPYQVTWLNSDEFVIMFYFLTGVHFLPEIYVKKYKSKKVFQKCLEILDAQLQELKGIRASERCFPLNQLTKKIIRLRFIRYYINYYQVWMNFLDKNFTGIEPLNDFLESFNTNKFSNEELCCYKLLIPKIFYLFGIFFQYKGDLKAAKYYYMRVRNLTLYEQDPSSEMERISILQSSLGFGGDIFQSKEEFSELYIYSTLHLVMIAEFEAYRISNFAQNSTQLTNDRDDSFRFRSVLYQDLAKVFAQKNKKTSNSFNMNLAGSRQTLTITYNLLLRLYDTNYSENGRVNFKSSDHSRYVEFASDAIKNSYVVNSFPYLASLLHFVTYLLSSNVSDKEEALEKCLSLTSTENCSDNERIVNLFILKDYCLQLHNEGDHDKGSFVETQTRYIHDLLRSKFQLLSFDSDHIPNHLA